VGANFEGKPNYMTIAFAGVVNMNPGMVAIGANSGHITTKGIYENETFSINFPNEDMIEITDYIGINSGKNIDKSNIFDNFYGDLKTAPMIKECPVNIECRVFKVIKDTGSDDIIIGEIVETYADEKALTREEIDIEKVNPITFSWKGYYSIGDFIAKAWDIGNNYNKK